MRYALFSRAWSLCLLCLLAGFVSCLSSCGDDTVQLGNTPPEVTFTSPTDGESLPEGATLTLIARVHDDRTTLDDLAYVWASSLQGTLEGTQTISGDSVYLTVSGMLPGEHTLTLKATDTSGATGTATVGFTVARNQAPAVGFLEPLPGQSVALGVPVHVEVKVQDPDETNLNAIQLSWGGDATDSPTAPATPGSNGLADFYLPDLPLGTHSVSINVQDSFGGTASAAVAFLVVQPDKDGDGYQDVAVGGNDCDDTRADVNPAAQEHCNGIDDNCDGTIDEGTALEATLWYADEDNDGYGDPTASIPACSRPEGYRADDTDCDDSDAGVNPVAIEACNGVDDDCDGAIDEDSATGTTAWYRDADSDGYGTSASYVVACNAPPGYVGNHSDCDDSSIAVHPGAIEVCDGLDNDCDGTIDGSAATAGSWYPDADKDGFGKAGSTPVVTCTPPTGYVSNDYDCNDANGAINPLALEKCDGIDNNCNGSVDEAGATDAATWYLDADNDGYGDPGVVTAACSQPSGYRSNSLDCNDASAAVNPSATEICDGIDNNCNGSMDESTAADAATWYLDADKDGYGTSGTTQKSCATPDGYSSRSGDCKDNDPAVHPGATEKCDGIDNDCDGTVDQYAVDTKSWCADRDGDGYGDASATLSSCTAPNGYVAVCTDCNDANSGVNPGTRDICGDSTDNNCDGKVDNCPISGILALVNSDAIMVGESSSDLAGAALSAAGDVNNDGQDDVLVGAYQNDYTGNNSGSAYLANGAISGTLPLAQSSAVLYGDVRAGLAGWAVSSAGDVNSDGYDDLLVGAPYVKGSQTASGIAYLLYGPISGSRGLSSAEARLSGGYSNGYAGNAVARGGDLNGDGFDDILVGAYGEDSNGAEAGSVYVFLGPVYGSKSLSNADAHIYGESTGNYAGFSVASAGDVNGDGLDDVLVGAYGNDTGGQDAGAAYLLYGPVIGNRDLATADVKFVGELAGDYAGYSVASAGDLNHDGYADLLIGAYGNDTGGSNAGIVYVIYGPVKSGTRSLSTADARLVGEAAEDRAGFSVAAAGDVDGDGKSDILVGAYLNDAGGKDSGAAYLLYGPVTGTKLLRQSDAKFLGAAASDNAGFAVSSAGDVDADGFDDLLIGAPKSGGNGIAYLVLGGLM